MRLNRSLLTFSCPRFHSDKGGNGNSTLVEPEPRGGDGSTTTLNTIRAIVADWRRVR